MKAKVIIEQGRTKVILTPENDFETDIIEKVADAKVNYNVETTVSTDFLYHSHTKHKIELNLIKRKENECN